MKQIVSWAEGNSDHKSALLEMSRSADRRTSVNALWVMTHLPDTEMSWLESLQGELIERLLTEQDTARKRLYLQLLRQQDFAPDNIGTVRLLDYCFSKINAECEPYAVRCFSIYIAYKICRPYPELIAELEQYLDLLSLQSLSSGLRSALRQTRRHIQHLQKSFHDRAGSHAGEFEVGQAIAGGSFLHQCFTEGK